MFTWTPILTIKGKLLTQHYTEITMEDVRAHAQVYQDRAARDAIGQGDELSTPSSNTGNSSDEGTSDCVSQASDTTVQEDNEEDTEAEDDSPVGAVDPSYVDDINSELQDQGIGVGKDQFSTDIHILGHTLRKGKLDLRVRLGSSLIPTKVSWEDLRVDTPSTLANYILTHKIGAKSEDPESRKPYEWAKGYVPNARRASVMLEQTYGVYAPNLFKIRRAQLSDTKRKRKRSVSRNKLRCANFLAGRFTMVPFKPLFAHQGQRAPCVYFSNILWRNFIY